MPARLMNLRRTIIALVAVGLLCWVAWYFLAGGWDYASYKTCEQDLRRLARSVEEFAHKHGRLPTTEEGVSAFAPPHLIHDPWGSEYRFHPPSKSRRGRFDIYSVGPDKVEGTPDDIEYKAGSGE